MEFLNVFFFWTDSADLQEYEFIDQTDGQSKTDPDFLFWRWRDFQVSSPPLLNETFYH